MRIPACCKKPSVEIALLAIAIALLFGLFLGERPYSAPSESRYVEIGREMAESNDFITPRLNYVKYFEKPPLFYWMQALWTKIAGYDFFAARVPTAFLTLLLCMVTYGLGRMLHDRLTGVLSALIMATCIYTFALSRIVLLDVPVSLFMVATLTSFLYAVNAPPGRARTWAVYMIYITAAAAVLTKGLIGAVLPGAVIFLWLLATNRWNLLATMRIPTGTLLFLLITVPWHVLVWQHNPEQPQFYFIHEHWDRYTTKVHGRYHPFWFFGAVLLAGFFPWTGFVAHAAMRRFKNCWSHRRENGNDLFLALWVGFIFLFFSVSDSKLIPYILPIFPPLAVITGDYFARFWREERGADAPSRKGFLLEKLILMALLAAIALAPIVLQNILSADSKAAQAIMQSKDMIGVLSITALIAVVALFVAQIQGRARHVIMLMIAIAAIIVELGDKVADNYSKDSMQQFGGALKALAKPEDEVVMYDNYYQDLPIYLGRRVTIVHWKGELQFGTEHEDTSAWMIDYPEFWKRWLDPKRHMFVILREDAFDRILKEKPKQEDNHFYGVLRDGRNILFSNQPVQQQPAQQQQPEGKHP